MNTPIVASVRSDRTKQAMNRGDIVAYRKKYGIQPTKEPDKTPNLMIVRGLSMSPSRIGYEC